MKKRSLSSPQFCRSKSMVPACALFCEGSFGCSTCIMMGARAKRRDPMARQEARKGDRHKACFSTTLKRERHIHSESIINLARERCLRWSNHLRICPTSSVPIPFTPECWEPSCQDTQTRFRSKHVTCVCIYLRLALMSS